jgi:hypothetical protein
MQQLSLQIKVRIDKENHVISMKGTMLQKDITIIKTHAPNLSAKSSIMKTLQDKKAKTTPTK